MSLDPIQIRSDVVFQGAKIKCEKNVEIDINGENNSITINNGNGNINIDSNIIISENKILDVKGDLDIEGDLTIEGKINATTFNARSDARLKKNIKEYKNDNSILNLPIYEFDYINGNQHTIGCLAQDLQKICPELVHEDENGILSISEIKLLYLIILEMKKWQTMT